MSRYAVPGYEMVRLLGRGGMGAVYLARRVADGRSVALKVSRGQLGKQGLDRLRREAELLSRIESPYLPRFVEAQELEQGFVLAMEFVQGDPLQAYVDEGGGPEERLELARRALPGIAHGLLALHQVEIIHRDLKPANAILTPERCVLVDLGLARGPDVRTLTKTGLSVGTPAYLPPEQISGEIAGPAADLYQVGLIARDLLLGSRSAPGQDVVQEAMQRAVSRPEDPRVQAPWIPAPLAEWITAALHPTPSQRPPPSEHLQRLNHLCQQPLSPSGPPGDAAVATWLEGPTAVGGVEGAGGAGVARKAGADGGAASTPSAGKPVASPTPDAQVASPATSAPRSIALALTGVLLLGLWLGFFRAGRPPDEGSSSRPRLVMALDESGWTLLEAPADLHILGDPDALVRDQDGRRRFVSPPPGPPLRLRSGAHEWEFVPPEVEAPMLRDLEMVGTVPRVTVGTSPRGHRLRLWAESRMQQWTAWSSPSIDIPRKFLALPMWTIEFEVSPDFWVQLPPLDTRRWMRGLEVSLGVPPPGPTSSGPISFYDKPTERWLEENFARSRALMASPLVQPEARFARYLALADHVQVEWFFRRSLYVASWAANLALGPDLSISHQPTLVLGGTTHERLVHAVADLKLDVGRSHEPGRRQEISSDSRSSMRQVDGWRTVFDLAGFETYPPLAAEVVVHATGMEGNTRLRVELGQFSLLVPGGEKGFRRAHRVPPDWFRAAVNPEGILTITLELDRSKGFDTPVKARVNRIWVRALYPK